VSNIRFEWDLRKARSNLATACKRDAWLSATAAGSPIPWSAWSRRDAPHLLKRPAIGASN